MCREIKVTIKYILFKKFQSYTNSQNNNRNTNYLLQNTTYNTNGITKIDFTNNFRMRLYNDVNDQTDDMNVHSTNNLINLLMLIINNFVSEILK